MDFSAYASQAMGCLGFPDLVKGSKITFEIPDSQYKIAVSSYYAEERISDCFEVNMVLVSEGIVDPEEVMEVPGVLTVAGISSNRYFHGIIREFRQIGRNGRFYIYEACLVPALWFASINEDCRIFQKKSVIEIVKKILEEYDITSDQYEFRGVDEKKYKEKSVERRHCVQYREPDLNFFKRILEEEGIYFFFEHSRDKHLLVFADKNIAFKKISQLYPLKDDILEFRDYSGKEESTEAVREFYYSRSICPGTVLHNAFNFKQPATLLDAQKVGNTHKGHVIYDYPCNYGDNKYGKDLAQVRLEEQKVYERVSQVSSNCPLLMPGMTFDLKGHDFTALDDTYIVINIRHEGRQSHVIGEKSGIGGDFSYSNSFSVIQKSVTYRPGRLTRKPYMRGMQTATVVGPSDQEIYTDQYGRVKVLFHWDREAKAQENKEESSCWLRPAQPWGGGGWGTVFIPRIGDEVLIDFMEGDPDWPIIVGSVYNELNKPLYALPAHMTRSVIKTRSTPKSTGFNELRFEDRAGNEEIFIHGEKDWNIVIKNDKTQTIGHDESLSVGNNRTKSVGVNQSESIGANKNIQVGMSHSENIGANMGLSVGANKNETVGINSSETVGAAKELTVGGLYQVSVGAVMNETVGADKSEEVIGLKAVIVGLSMQEYVKADRKSTVDGDYSESIKKTHSEKAHEYILEANTITLKAGASTMVIDGGSITLKSPRIFTN